MGILRDLVAGFGGVGEIGYICKLNPNRSLGRMRIFLDYFLRSFGFYKMPFACF